MGSSAFGRGRPVLAVVGAMGAVGAEVLDLLSTRADVYGEIRLAGPPRSAGGKAAVRGERVEVAAVAAEVFDGVDIAMFAGNGREAAETAARWAPVAVERGAVAVDGTGAFRDDPLVPLVVPGIGHGRVRERPRGIVAGPGATTLTMIAAIDALHRRYGLRRLVVASYQAASEEGRAGVDALHAQMERVGGDRTLGHRAGDVRGAAGDPGPFAAPLALNVVPWAGSLADGGWTSAERAVRDEARRLLGLPGLKVTATCVQVPVVTGIALAVHAVFGERTDRREAQAVLAGSPGVVLCDVPESHEFPTPADVVGTDPAWAGRVRRSEDDPKALDLFLCGDNLRQGAALNIVRTAELVAAGFAGSSGPTG